MFVDTNVLEKSRILEAPDHEIARASLESAFERPEPLRISRQIMRKYLAVVTRPQTWAAAIAREEALEDVERLAATFDVLEDGPAVTEWIAVDGQFFSATEFYFRMVDLYSSGIVALIDYTKYVLSTSMVGLWFVWEITQTTQLSGLPAAGP